MPSSDWEISTRFYYTALGLSPTEFIVQTVATTESSQIRDEPGAEPTFLFSQPYEGTHGEWAYGQLLSNVQQRRKHRSDVPFQTEEFLAEVRVPEFNSPPEAWTELSALLPDPEARTVIVKCAQTTSWGVLTIAAGRAVYTRVGRPILEAIGKNLALAVDEYMTYKREKWTERRQISTGDRERVVQTEEATQKRAPEESG